MRHLIPLLLHPMRHYTHAALVRAEEQAHLTSVRDTGETLRKQFYRSGRNAHFRRVNKKHAFKRLHLPLTLKNVTY